MSLLAATILAAWATVVLAVGAVITARLAWMAYKKQAQEVKAIEQQVTDQRELTTKQGELLAVQADQLKLQQQQFDQQEQDRRQDQANRVFMWVETETDQRLSQAVRASLPGVYLAVNVHVKNTSQQPVYGLSVNWRKGTAPWDEPEYLAVLMPGLESVFVHPIPDDLPASVDRSIFSAVVIFRDRAQRWWRIWPDGRFEELETGAEPPHS
jgi:hypothetical protein